MQKGFDVKDKLKPLWDRLPGKSAELAERSGIGRNTLSSYNSGNKRPSLPTVQRIADALGVDMMEILGEGDAATDTALLTQIVTLLEEDPTQAAGEVAPLLLRLADELQELSFRLRQAVARQGERWRSG